MEKYFPTIGLEIHAELKTKSKMFCSCANDPDEREPNANVCPICMGHPGTLPVPNRQALKHVLKVGLAVGGEIADFTEFDRKNYFYPDIPKGYQISQYKWPLIKGGSIRGVELTRIHLEEDTARSTHESEGASLVDFNRAGLPLMELVTEPVIHDAGTAVAFAKELQLILRYLGASDADMEKGHMRVEANISVSKDKNQFGTKVEVKNLNSFKSVERAIKYELDRHISLLEKGEKIVQETRGFDENTGKTFSQRSKEEAHDYRYFPEPDIPKFYLSQIPEFSRENLEKEMPELPEAKRARYAKEYGVKEGDIEFFVGNIALAKFFESAIENFCDDRKCVALASNYIVSDLAGLMKGAGLEEAPGHLFPSSFGKLILMIEEGKLSSRGAKDTLAILFKDGGEPEQIAEKNGWILKNDPEALKIMLQKIVSENQNIVAEYRGGKDAALNSLVGRAMKETGGSYSPQAIKESLISLI